MTLMQTIRELKCKRTSSTHHKLHASSEGEQALMDAEFNGGIEVAASEISTFADKLEGEEMDDAQRKFFAFIP